MTKRLCWNCEGEVDSDSENCRYCGVDLGGEATTPPANSSFEPAYKIVQPDREQAAPKPVYQSAASSSINDSKWQESLNGEQGQQEMKAHVDGVKTWLYPLVMLLAGSVAFLFGLVLFLFSEDGVFTLRWNANFSLFYLVAAVPLLYYGWQALQKVED